MDWYAMMATDKSRIKGKKEVLTIVDPSTRRGSQGGARSRQNKATDCLHCDWKGNKESECWKKKADSDRTELGRAKLGNQHISHYAKGSSGAGTGPTFSMKPI